MTPWLQPPPRSGAILVDAGVVSPCCLADVVPLVRWALDGETVRLVSETLACRECRRETGEGT